MSGIVAVTIKNKTWDRLRTVAAAARKRFPVDRDAGRYYAGLDCLGLILESRPRLGGYWCTPTNTLSFAWNGGGGTHFSFVVQNNRVHDRSPIVCTVPEPGDQHNFIVGENLSQFLSLGYYLGYFCLEQLAFDLDRTLRAFVRPNWKAETEKDLAEWAGPKLQSRSGFSSRKDAIVALEGGQEGIQIVTAQVYVSPGIQRASERVDGDSLGRSTAHSVGS